jgi:hypothetical protein
MSSQYPRSIHVTARDANGELLRGAAFEWYVNGQPAGGVLNSDGHTDITPTNSNGTVRVDVSYPGQKTQTVTLALAQNAWNFPFPEVEQNPNWRQFAMKHFPAIIGIVFIVAAVVLVFAFSNPNPLQTHIVLALFALGGGGFGGEIAGFIKADIKFGQQLAISAGGAAAIFALLYFFVPAGA